MKKKDNRKYSDRATYLKMAVSRRRKALRQKAIEYKGGKCIFCGYNKYEGVLEFHHIDETKKNFGLSEKEYCVFAMHTGKLVIPHSANCFI